MLAVVRTGEEAYGMNVRRELESVTGREITIGSVYATLDRLEAKELVASSRQPGSDAASRRVFAITGRGAVARSHPGDARSAVDRRQAPGAAERLIGNRPATAC